MRFLILCGATLLAACASTGEPTAFAPNQVWTLADPPSPDARLVVDALQAKGGRTLVHYSVVMQAPREAVRRGLNLQVEDWGTLAMSREDPGPPQFLVDSAFLSDMRWRGWSVTAASAYVPDERAPVVFQISGLTTYADVLRPALGRLAEAETPPEFATQFRDAHGVIVPVLPERHEEVLARPLPDTLEDIAAWWRGEGAPLPDMPELPRFDFERPRPAMLPEADEEPAEDGALDAACRAIRVPPPPIPDPRWEEAIRAVDERLAAIGQEPRSRPPLRPAPTLSNVMVTRSPQWGLVWRGDLSYEGGQIGSSVLTCWRSSEGGIETFGYGLGIGEPSPLRDIPR